MNRLHFVVLLVALVAEPAPAVTQQDSFPVISPQEAEFIADEMPYGSELAEKLRVLGSRLTQAGIAVWGIPELDSTEAGVLWGVVDIWVRAFDEKWSGNYTDLSVQRNNAAMKTKYWVVLGLLAKIGPNGVNLITTNK